MRQNHLSGVHMIVKLKFSGKIVTIFDDYNFHTEQATEYAWNRSKYLQLFAHA